MRCLAPFDGFHGGEACTKAAEQQKPHRSRDEQQLRRNRNASRRIVLLLKVRCIAPQHQKK